MNLFDHSIEESAGRQSDKSSDERKERSSLGLVVGGSLSEGMEVRLDPAVSTEEIQVGNFVTLRGQAQRFFGMIGDIGLGNTDNRLRASPPDVNNSLVHEVLAGTVAFGTFRVKPRLILPQIAGAEVPDLEKQGKLPTARTVPPHFSIVSKATETDMVQVFGREDERSFWVGNPLDMETKICLDMETFVQLSNGVFGKSGTGKSFLTRLLLTGMIQKTETASLVFDMHGEYGWAGRDPERGRDVKGLKQLFPSKVAVFTLDPEGSLARKIPIESEIRIAYSEIQPEDVELLATTLGITPLGIQAVHRLPRFLGPQWLEQLINLDGGESLSELAVKMGETVGTLGALQRRLYRLSRMPFLVSNASADPLNRILECLERGTHVVLEFGVHGRSLEAYILVANLLTRRIFERYIRWSQEAEGGSRPKPRPLTICIEEAHRFLAPSIADQTIFGTIAREGRKFNVTLLIIDQRPSGIDREVRSQLGTRLVYPLDDELDTEAVLSGAGESRELRNVLASLESRQQVLIFGVAVPIPVVVRVREYGSALSYEELTRSNVRPRRQGSRPGCNARQRSAAKDAEDDLFG